MQNPRIKTEIERVLNVFNQLIGDIEFIQYVSPYDTSHNLDQSHPLKSDLQTLYDLEGKMKQALDHSSKSRQERMDLELLKQQEEEMGEDGEGIKSAEDILKPSVEVPQFDIPALSQDISQHVRHLVFLGRQLKKQQGDVGMPEYVNPQVEQFLSVLKQYREVIVDKLTTTVEEEDSRTETLNETTAREKKATADVKALKRELTSERSIRDREMSEREAAVKKLKQEITHLQDDEESARRAYNDKLSAKEMKKSQEYQMMKDYLMNQIAVISGKLAEKKEDNQSLEGKMRIVRKNSETKVGSIVKKYDEFMTEATDKLKQLKEDFEKDEKRDFERQERLRRNLVRAQAYANAKMVIARAWKDYKARHQKKKGKKGRKKKG